MKMTMQESGQVRKPAAASQPRVLGWSIAVVLVLISLVTAMAPVERTLGELARLIYFHGSWVWAGKIFFAGAAISGLAGLLLRSRHWLRTSLALGWVGMVFWLTYLPMSLYVQQASWGGIFWDEPRWRIPLMFGVVGALVQAGLFLMEDYRLAATGNLAFGIALWWLLGNIQNVLHPDSPIFQSDALRIQIFFVALLSLSVLFGALLSGLLFRFTPSHWK